MRQPIHLDDLHDATLTVLNIQWAIKTISLILKVTGSEEVCLAAEGLTQLRCSRLDPWGPSASVNEATFANGVLVIEMQSGDFINAEISSYKLIPSAGTTA